MRAITTQVYKFDELSAQAKERARDWYKNGDYFDYFAENVIYDAKTVGAIMGIDLDKVYYSGFSSQGDGASYTGHYGYKKGALKALKEYAPQDSELHRICEALQDIQRTQFYRISAHITQSGYYQHENTMSFTYMLDGEYLYNTVTWEDDITDTLRDFARWIYKQLETSYDWSQSDSAVDENITAGEYEFTEGGKIS